MFKIGEFSKFTRVSVKMLRHYDELGLLKPVRVDPLTHYRYYSADQLPRLNRIIALKDLGFSLEQIADLLDSDLTSDEVKGMLKLRRAEIQQQLQREQHRLAQVEAHLEQLSMDTAMAAYDVVVRQVEAQQIASIRRAVSAADDLIPPLFEMLEAYVSRFNKRLPQPPLTISHGTEYLEQGLDIEVAVPLSGPLSQTDLIKTRPLEGVATMACVVHTGAYATLNQAYMAMLTWIEANPYAIAGPTRVIYLRFGADNQGYELPDVYLTQQAAEFVTEIQVPLKKPVME